MTRLAPALDIRLDDPRLPHAREMLADHLAEMFRNSPPESVHALDVEGLCDSNVTFWTGWHNQILVVCGALKQLGEGHGEIKSMRTIEAVRGAGCGEVMLQHLVAEARLRGLTRLSLETGSQPEFRPARQLYAKHGFVETGPFADYWNDPNSVFMTRELNRG